MNKTKDKSHKIKVGVEMGEWETNLIPPLKGARGMFKIMLQGSGVGKIRYRMLGAGCWVDKDKRQK